jgi:hypothetical protein
MASLPRPPVPENVSYPRDAAMMKLRFLQRTACDEDDFVGETGDFLVWIVASVGHAGLRISVYTSNSAKYPVYIYIVTQ